MGEIIQLQVGQCGNQIGSEYWEVVNAEHGIDLSGSSVIDNIHNSNRSILYRMTPNEKYIPRCCLIDLEPNVINSIRTGPMGKLFHPDNYVTAMHSAGNNWARGYYSDGNELIESVLDVVRKEVEACECLQGFQLVHSLGGGTGSGLGTLMISKLREQYPEKLFNTTSVLPSPSLLSDVVIEPYNALLSLHQLIENVDTVTCIENAALHDICKKNLLVSDPSYPHLNKLIAHLMSGINCGVRFPGQLNGDMRKMAVNLVPFPRLHFLTPSIAPLSSTIFASSTGVPPTEAVNMSIQSSSVSQLTSQLFNPANLMIKAPPGKSKYLTACCQYRGAKVSTRDIELSLSSLKCRSDLFVPWLANNKIWFACDKAPIGFEKSAVMLGNYSGISSVFEGIRNNFKKMFNRRAFVHTYESEGLQELEFSEAESNLCDLMDEYSLYISDELSSPSLASLDDFVDTQLVHEISDLGVAQNEQ